MPDPGRRRRRSRDHLVARIQRGVDRGLKRFIAGPLDRYLRVATAQPGLVITSGIALIILSVALVPAGIIRMNFMPTVEADLVTATLEMPEGTPAARTSDMADFVEASGHRAIARLSPESSGSLLEGVNMTVGQEARSMDPFGARAEADPRSNLAAVEFKLVTAEFRDVSAADFQQAWRDELGSLPEARALNITAELLNFGSPVHVELAHPDPGRLTSVVDTLMERLRAFEGVFDVRADQDQGLREIQLDLRRRPGPWA